MSKVNGNQPVQLNSIDQIFNGRSGGDTAINTGLINGYGKDNDVTYLISHLKKDDTITVDRDVDGHLSWKIGTTDVKIGSSWWTRVKHSVKKFFSAKYKDASDIKVMQNADKIRRAYAVCLQQEEAKADVDNNYLANLKDLRQAADDVIAQNEKDANDLILQKQEEIRVAKEAKDQKISDLTSQINTGEGELAELRENRTNANDKIQEQNDKLTELNTSKDALLTKEAYESLLGTIKTVRDTFKEINLYANDEEKQIIRTSEGILGVKLVNNIDAWPPVLNETVVKQKENEINQALESLNGYVTDIEERNKMIIKYQEIVQALETQISEKETAINTLRTDLQAEQAVEEEEVSEETTVEEPIPKVIDAEPEVSAEDQAIANTMQNQRLDRDEAIFYNGLNANEKELYDNLRKPADRATDCTPFADFFVSVLKGRGVKRTANGATSTITLSNPGVVSMRLGGDPSTITLPAKFTMTYAVDKQTWTLNGKGLRIELYGHDVNLDETRFEIRANDLNIKAESSKQSFFVRMGIATAYKNIPVAYDVVKQDAFHSDNQVV